MAGKCPESLEAQFIEDCARLTPASLAEKYGKSPSTIKEWRTDLFRRGKLLWWPGIRVHEDREYGDYLELVSGSADNNYYCNIAMRTVTDSGTRTPIFIDGDAQRVSIYDTTPDAATFSVRNPGNNEPTCSFQQIASDKAVLHLKHTHANVYYFNFEGGHTDRDGYNAVRVYLQGVGTRWIRLYDTDA